MVIVTAANTTQFVAHCNELSQKAVDFQTGFTSDRNLSTYRENYIILKISDHKEQFDRISYCFRIQYYSTISQCLFAQNIVFKFNNNYQ